MEEINNYRLINVKLSDIDSISKFKIFYNDIFMKEFSDPKICESIEHYINVIRLKQKGEIGDDDIIITLLYYDKKIIGGIIYVYLSNVNSCFIEYEVIDKNYRNNGFGHLLFEKAKSNLDIIAKSNGNSEIKYIFAEVDKIEINKPYNSYNKFWHKLFFKRLKFEYIQPKINKKSIEDRDHMLIVYAKKDINSITLELFQKVLQEYFIFSFGIKKPKNLKVYKEMFKNYKDKTIKLID